MFYSLTLTLHFVHTLSLCMLITHSLTLHVVHTLTELLAGGGEEVEGTADAVVHVDHWQIGILCEGEG